jgi:hypothetical protein
MTEQALNTFQGRDDDDDDDDDDVYYERRWQNVF